MNDEPKISDEHVNVSAKQTRRGNNENKYICMYVCVCMFSSDYILNVAAKVAKKILFKNDAAIFLMSGITYSKGVFVHLMQKLRTTGFGVGMRRSKQTRKTTRHYLKVLKAAGKG